MYRKTSPAAIDLVQNTRCRRSSGWCFCCEFDSDDQKGLDWRKNAARPWRNILERAQSDGASLRTPMPHLDSDHENKIRPARKAITTDCDWSRLERRRTGWDSQRGFSHSQANALPLHCDLESPSITSTRAQDKKVYFKSVRLARQANQRKEYLSPFTRISTHKSPSISL